MKQPQYEPLAIERQVLILFTGAKGYLDKVAEKDVADYERQLYEHFEVRHAEILQTLVDQKKIDDQLETDLHNAVDEFTKQFVAARQGAAA